MQPNGTLALATSRVFSHNLGERPGIPDGMKVDTEGNVYVGGSGGVWIIDPSGQALGNHRNRRPAAHQYVFRRRRLEDAVLHQLGQALVGAGQYPRHPRADAAPGVTGGST